MRFYHYTIEERVQQIIDSGQINVSTDNVSHKKEKPVAWVSSNPTWEHTATKMTTDGFGNYRKLTFEEQLKNFGCGRIVIESNRMMTWAKLKHVAKMDLNMANRMENAGIECGGKPSEWFGSLTPILSNEWVSAQVFRNNVWAEIQSFN